MHREEPLHVLQISEQQHFQIKLSERDDEALLGVAKVTCFELEALKKKLSSTGDFRNHFQKELMSAVVDRAHKGSLVGRPSYIIMDRELMRPSPFWDGFDGPGFYYR